MGEVRIRRATPDEGIVVAALRLQAARADGAAPETGFLDRFARAWDADAHPTWLAELDGTHAGVLIAQVVPSLPSPGVAPGDGGRLLVSTLFVAGGESSPGVAEALTETMTTWARDRRLTPTEA